MHLFYVITNTYLVQESTTKYHFVCLYELFAMDLIVNSWIVILHCIFLDGAKQFLHPQPTLGSKKKIHCLKLCVKQLSTSTLASHFPFSTFLCIPGEAFVPLPSSLPRKVSFFPLGR